jgi:hypothetical protein
MPIGITTKPMLFSTVITKWQTTKPEGSNRVKDKTNGTTYLLNTNRLDGMRDMSSGTQASLYYFDNPFNSRDNSHYMEITHTVAAIVAHMDTVPTHTHMDLKIFPDMDHSETSVTTVIPIDNFAFATAVDDAHSATQSYVWYVDSGWNFKRCRVEQSLAELLALVA